MEEEKSFLRTLEGGLKRLNQLSLSQGDTLDGEVAFQLYDTFGFPIDLTRLIGSEAGWSVDNDGFQKALQSQKDRGRADAKKVAGDWIDVNDVEEVEFIGYDHHQAEGVRIVKHRTVTQKEKEIHHIVLDRTPFYAESGGQVGDSGLLDNGSEKIKILDTQKENDLIVHTVEKLPNEVASSFKATINLDARKLTENNHTATHLLHAALRDVLGTHVQQRGSLVNKKQLRFDFSHFEKMTNEQIARVEQIVNDKVRANIQKIENRNVSIDEAKSSGAMMLFGEKYGEFVRMITFDPDYSVELCGGCHVDATGQIGLFKIKRESAIAAGVRRIEAVTSKGAEQLVNNALEELSTIKSQFKNPKNITKQIADLIAAHKLLEKEMTQLKSEKASGMKDELVKGVVEINGYKVLTAKLKDVDMNAAKTLAYQLEQTIGDSIVLLGLDNGEKANLILLISKNLVSEKLNAGAIIRQISAHIKGGGGGQPFFATAGGKDSSGLDQSLTALKEII